ncbi:hypothetical protein FGO68_gene12174 [Halteria grandinella]|uniref:PAZ domain-containing protein n=1 Tax=Halteria grandinella TaxID=5974 RepID=A0A8J8N9M1_HALGN|nr:hypothetical protein FGO68_gene12174 [Halteria grandinella]
MAKRNADMIQTFVQAIVKRSLQERDYKQIGRLPKFFNSKEKILADFNLQVWPGFSCEVQLVSDGLFLNVDAITKFLRRETILDMIDELYEQGFSKEQVSQKLTPDFEDDKSSFDDTRSENSFAEKSRLVVITSYNSREYQIEGIEWQKNPKVYQFLYNKKDPITGNTSLIMISLAEYMEERYKIVLKGNELKQPLLYLQHEGQKIYLVPSLCHVSKLPPNFLKDKMRALRKFTITDVNTRFKEINNLVSTFGASSVDADDCFEKWGIKLSQECALVNGNQLFHPTIEIPGTKEEVQFEEFQRNRLFTREPMDLTHHSWAIIQIVKRKISEPTRDKSF